MKSNKQILIQHLEDQSVPYRIVFEVNEGSGSFFEIEETDGHGNATLTYPITMHQGRMNDKNGNIVLYAN